MLGLEPPIGPRARPALYLRASICRRDTARYGRELLRVIGGLPDHPHNLEAARTSLLRLLVGRATQRASGVREVSAALELRGRRNEAYIVRRWAGIAGGLNRLRECAREAAKVGGQGHVTARALRWALARL